MRLFIFLSFFIASISTRKHQQHSNTQHLVTTDSYHHLNASNLQQHEHKRYSNKTKSNLVITRGIIPNGYDRDETDDADANNVNKEVQNANSRTINFEDIISTFGKENKDGSTSYELFGCALKLSSDNCKFDFTPDKECKEKVSLAKLYQTLLNKGDMGDITKSFLPIHIFQIDKFLLDKCIGDVEFTASPKEPFDIVRDKIKISKGSMTVSFNYKTMSENPTFEGLGFLLKAEIQIGDKAVPLELEKKRNKPHGHFSIKTDVISVEEFRGLFSKKELAPANVETPEKVGMFSKAAIRNPVIRGHRFDDGGWEFILNGKGTGIEGFGDVMVFVIAMKPADDSTGVGLVADIKEIIPAQIISVLTGKDLSNIPLVKDLSFNVALEIANKDLPTIEDKAMNKLLMPYLQNGKTLASGTKIKLELPIKEILQKSTTKINLQHIPEKFSMHIFITNGDVHFVFPDDAPLDIANIAVALIPKVPEILFEQIMKNPPKIRVKNFNINLKTENVDIALEAKELVTLGNDMLTIKDVDFYLTHKPNGPWDFGIKGKATIGDATMDVSVVKKGDNYEFIGSITELTLKEMLKTFAGDKIDSSVLDKVEFLNFGLKSAKIISKFGDQMSIRVTGNPVLFGWEGLLFEGLITDSSDGKAMFLGIVMKDIRMDLLVEKIFKKKILQTSWMSQLTVCKNRLLLKEGARDLSTKRFYQQNLITLILKQTCSILLQLSSSVPVNISHGVIVKEFRYFGKNALQALETILVSNTDAPKDKKEVGFTLPELQSLKIKKGVFFSTELTFPDDCKKDPLCEIVKEKLNPDSKFYLTGEITTAGMKLTAGANDISFGTDGNFMLKKVSLVLVVGVKDTGFTIEGEMKIQDPPLNFKCKLALGLTGKVELKATMDGMWKRPFNLKYIAFGNIQAGVSIEPAMPIPALELSAEVWIGKIGNDKEIKSKTAISFNPTNAIENYFYGDINKLTIQSISEALEFETNLPQAVLESGFPEGLVVGYSTNPKGKTIEHLKVKLPKGLIFKGKINILGFEAKCNIEIDFPTKFVVDVQLPVVNLMKGVVQLRKTFKDHENGPTLYVHATKKEVDVKVAAYVELLGIGAETNIDISNKGLKFYLYGNLFGLLAANLTVQTTGKIKNLNDSKLFVASCISTNAQQVSEATKGIIVDAADATDEALQEGDDEVANKWFEKASAKMDAWNEKLERKQAVIKRKSGKLDLIREKLDDKCVDACEDVCLGGPTINKKCKKLPGFKDKWISCPGWDDCKTKVEDLACVAKCKANKLKLSGKALKKKVTMEILLDAIVIIQKILEKVKDFVLNAQKLAELAEKAKEKMDKAVEGGKKALAAITEYTKENIVNLRSICFNASLEAAHTKCFGFNVDVVLGGKKEIKIDAQACLEGNWIKRLAKSIGKQVFPGIDSLKEKLQKAKTYISNVRKKEEELSEMEKETDAESKELEGKIVEQNHKDDDDEEENEGEKKRAAKKDTHNERPFNQSYIRHQIYGDFPSVTIRDDVSMDAFDLKSPWSFSHSDSPFISTKEFEEKMERLAAEQQDEISSDFFAGLTDTSDPTKCKQTRAVINTYNSIYGTLRNLATKMDESNAQFKNESENMKRTAESLEKEIQKSCDEGELSEEKQADSMYYVNKFKEGSKIWQEDVSKQMKTLDDSILKLYKQNYFDIIQKSHGVNRTQFMKILKAASHVTRKRDNLPNDNGDDFSVNLKRTGKIVRHLFKNNIGSLSQNEDTIDLLGSRLQKVINGDHSCGDNLRQVAKRKEIARQMQ